MAESLYPKWDAGDGADTDKSSQSERSGISKRLILGIGEFCLGGITAFTLAAYDVQSKVAAVGAMLTTVDGARRSYRSIRELDELSRQSHRSTQSRNAGQL